MSPGSFSFYNDPLLVPLVVLAADQRQPARHPARPRLPRRLLAPLPRGLPRDGGRRVAPPPAADRRRRRGRDHRRRLPAGRLPRAAEDLRPLAAALGLGRLRPLRQPQPLRRLPGDGRSPRVRLRARGDRPSPRGLGGEAALGWLLLGEQRGHRGRALVGGGHGPRGRPPRLAVAGRSLRVRVRPRRAPPVPRRAPPPRATALAVAPPRRASASSGSASGASSPPSRRAGSRAAASTCGATCCRWSRASRSSAWAGTPSRPRTRGTRPSGGPTGSARRTTTTCRRSSTAGSLGAALVAGLLAVVFRGALARASPLAARISASWAPSSASPLHGLVDFNGQIPANAATGSRSPPSPSCLSGIPAPTAALMRGESAPRMAGFEVLSVFPPDGARV